MKNLILLLVLLNANRSADLLSLADAEKILGESCKRTENLTEDQPNAKVFKTTYSAEAKDPQSGREINLYFMYEEYKYDSSAKRVYSEIKTSNQTHEGFQVLKGVGDEAYYHTDGKNFYFILARKGSKMMRMKLNKVTAKSSENEFKKISEKIVGKM